MADFPNASPIINKQEQQWSHFIIIHCPPSYADKWNPWKFNISTQPFTAVTLFHRMQWVGDRPPRFLILRRRYCQDLCNRITEVVAHALEIYIDASCLRFRDPKGLFGYLNLWGGREGEGGGGDECLTGIPDIFVIVFVWLIEEKWVYFHVRTIMEWFGFDWNPVFWITRWDYEFRWLGYCFRTRFFFL